jgi:conjugative relaxase-like TrwC/TraI family protein
MLRITPSTSAQGAKKYFTESLTRDDTSYYHEGQELAGTWGGKGAEMLGLSGEVAQKDFFALCDNKHPETGERLTPRNKEDRRVAFDFTWSAPKSVSVLYELSGDERILNAFRESVSETMQDIEGEMKTRVRKSGNDNDRETGNMVFAEFTHFTARPVEGVVSPHLHTHVYALNLTKDSVEDRWKAGQFGDLKRDATYFEAAFDARLAHKLNALGYATEKNPDYSFEIAGVPDSLIDKFSQRRNQIEAKAAEKGIFDRDGKHAIGYYGREHKKLDLGKAELRKEWDSRLTDAERSALVDAIHGRVKGDRVYSAEEAKAYALEHSFQRASTVSEKRLKAEALKYGIGSVLPDAVADIAQHPEVIAETRGGQRMTTTISVLRDEIAMLQFAKDGQRKFKPLVDTKARGEELAGLSNDQRNAAVHILGSRDQVVGVRGGAGTGKTHMLTTVNAVITSIEKGSGDYSRVYAFAQSTTASRGELRKVGFKDADTLATLFRNEEMQAKLHKQVMLVDEAGQVSTKEMRAIFDIARKQQARVVLVGDYRQHSSVEAGDAFRLIENEGGVRYAQLTEIRRQTEPGYRKAVEQISEGTGKATQKGFDALERMGNVIEASGEERHKMLVKDYLKAHEEGKSALIIAPTHSEGRKLTDALRSTLKERGALGTEREFMTRRSTGWTDAQKGDARNYEPGMVVEFHQNAKGFKRGEKTVVGKDDDGLYLQKTDGSRTRMVLDQANRFEVYRTREMGIAKGDRIRITKNGEARAEGQAKGRKVNNGDIYTVEGFTKDGDIRLEKGRVLPRDWGHMQMGYVDTSYASQGKTTDRVFISVGNESLPATNQQQWYVSASRGREQAKLYVDRKDDVRNAISRTGERLSAVELTGTKLKEKGWRSKVYESITSSRVSRFIKDRAAAISDYWNNGRGRVGYA